MTELFINLGDLIMAAWGVLSSILFLLLPWIALGAWVLYWLCAVNWKKLYAVLIPQFGWIGVVLLGFAMILVWSTVAPPAAGVHYILGLTVSNIVGKTVYVVMLFCIAGLCGAVQLSGSMCDCCIPDEPEEETQLSVHH